ncbi:MAG TPA: hypothetical protein DEB40_02250 [Elusimicrobia bacterium]|nr:hypothetical protein [Elusimicrobiota bacterium]HBT60551.1 hypothetical protein [Elusimicrobiota bacterium]
MFNLKIVVSAVVFGLAALSPAFATPTSAEPSAQNNICAIIREVIEQQSLFAINNFALVLRSTDCPNAQSGDAATVYLVNDDAVIRLIEETHHILFDDFVGKTPEPFRVEFQNARTDSVTIAGRRFQRIAAVKAVKVDAGSTFQQYTDFNPTCPEPDAHHRYVDAPISYAHPEQGTFRLYYEVNSDFDKAKPVVLVPTDAQRDSSQVGME